MNSKVKGHGHKVTCCIWQVLAHKSRTKSPRITKIVGTDNDAHCFQCQRSKVEVTRLTNDKTESESYLPKGKAYVFRTWYTQGTRKPVSPTSAMTSNVNGQDRKVTFTMRLIGVILLLLLLLLLIIIIIKLIIIIIIIIPQNLYGALYKQNSSKGAWQLKIKIKITK